MASKNVRSIFEERLKSVLHLFDLYKFNYAEVGIFGSYARGDYNSLSDLDICFIAENRPDRYLTGQLRCDAEELGADIIFVSPDYFKKDDSLFACNLRKDYRRLL